MKINKFISTNFISGFGYISLLVIFYGFIFQDYNFFGLSEKYLTLTNVTEIFAGIQALSILLFILFFVEKFYRKKYPTKLRKINIKNNILRNIYLFIFYIGFYISIIFLLGTFSVYILI